MTSVVFLDPVAADPYGGSASVGQALGGTEATVLRVAQQLSRLGHRVAVRQKARQREERDDYGVAYLPYTPEAPVPGSPAYSNVVLIRAQKLMKRVRDQNPVSRRWLWLHCFPGRRRRSMLDRAARYDFQVLTVSEALRSSILACSPSVTAAAQGHRIRVVYNVVEVQDALPGGRRDRNKLVFFSSPHKGIVQVLQRFAELREQFPDLRLHVANPGYIPGASLAGHPGVIDLGPLEHREVLRHVSEAFCVFCVQSSFAETFGLVFGEANALGTPVMAHPLGAAGEILGPSQLVDCDDPLAVIALFRRWLSEGPPAVGARPEFGLEAVTARWAELLGEGQT